MMARSILMKNGNLYDHHINQHKYNVRKNVCDVHSIIGRAELQILHTIIDEICLKVRHMNSERE